MRLSKSTKLILIWCVYMPSIIPACLAAPEWKLQTRIINKQGRFIGNIDEAQHLPNYFLPQVTEGCFNPHGRIERNENGKKVFKKNHAECPSLPWKTHYSEDFACVQIEPEGLIAYIDRSNRVVFKLAKSIKMGGDFHEGLAAVLVKKTGLNLYGKPTDYQMGFVDKSGKLSIPARYAYPFSGITSQLPGPSDAAFHRIGFSDGIARVAVAFFDAAYVDKKGRSIGYFDYGSDFKDGVAKVLVRVKTNGTAVTSDDIKRRNAEDAKYRAAVGDALREKLSVLKEHADFEFWLTIREDGALDARVTRPIAPLSLINKIETLLKSTSLPARSGSMPDASNYGWRYFEGELSQCEDRIYATPTLPPGAPVPDCE